jgi:hypothetical protein
VEKAVNLICGGFLTVVCRSSDMNGSFSIVEEVVDRGLGGGIGGQGVARVEGRDARGDKLR